MPREYLKNVTTVKVDAEKCTGCGLCVDLCPHRVLRMEEGKVVVHHPDKCIECGACSKNCPTEAVSVQAGVGCAYAMIAGKLRGKAPCCGPGSGCC